MKDKKILVDTSAWIVSFKRTGQERLKSFLKEAIDKNRVAITPVIVMELLQGCKTQREFDNLKKRLESLENCLLNDLAWERVYAFGFSLRRKGLTVPTVDILIAFISMERGYILLHHDHHFRKIAAHFDLNLIDFLDKSWQNL